MIGIIDYGMGNLRSVQKAFELLGAEAVILPAPAPGGDAGMGVGQVHKLVLPGVGAFGDGMEQLRRRGWIEPIREFVRVGKPLLGICLGMQLLFEDSEEDAAAPDQPVPGLAVLPGHVVRFAHSVPGAARLKVPHMGWNTLRWERDDPLLRGLAQDAAVYFVHSYYPRVLESEARPITSARAEYPPGTAFTATIWRDNVWATQFHPEKSQGVGLKMLANFAGL
jgi:glutamine amidotransferase